MFGQNKDINVIFSLMLAMAQVVLKSGPGTFFGLAIYGDYIFWTDWMQRSIMRCDKYTGGEMKVLRSDTAHQPMGIMVVANDTNNCKWFLVL